MSSSSSLHSSTKSRLHSLTKPKLHSINFQPKQLFHSRSFFIIIPTLLLLLTVTQNNPILLPNSHTYSPYSSILSLSAEHSKTHLLLLLPHCRKNPSSRLPSSSVSSLTLENLRSIISKQNPRKQEKRRVRVDRCGWLPRCSGSAASIWPQTAEDDGIWWGAVPTRWLFCRRRRAPIDGGSNCETLRLKDRWVGRCLRGDDQINVDRLLLDEAASDDGVQHGGDDGFVEIRRLMKSRRGSREGSVARLLRWWHSLRRPTGSSRWR
ncbi:hypothetical protein M6B38_112655 [Iris pallida]|uniref:Uncharacterized protein n=1 Tax=Iris pallida TaxID=29817 RepID=A0AAX6DMV4_IRIPA|nr:hypothetical protein M6B38_112655 [Iris pallida]